ncbi:PAS domain-containing protein [Croceimicrobium sp.]|uniref:PAS domain-containing protein n=1 Tax=Croceimicrobium sp. TaxID=2828340 RepID=UPI003BAAE063
MIKFSENDLSVSTLIEHIERSTDSKDKLNTLYLFLKTLYPSIFCGLIDQSQNLQVLNHWSDSDIETLHALDLRSKRFLQLREALLLDFDSDRQLLFIPGCGVNHKVKAVFFLLENSISIDQLNLIESLKLLASHIFYSSGLNHGSGNIPLWIVNKMLSHGRTIVALIDSDYRYRYVSPNVQKILAIRGEEPISKHVTIGIHPEDLKKVIRVFQENLDQNSDFELPVYRFRLNDSQAWRYFLTHISDLRKDPQVEGFISNTLDVTKEYEVKRELELSKELYRVVSTSTGDLIYEWNIITEEWTRQGSPLENLSGYKPEDIEGNFNDWWHSQIHPKDRDQAINQQLELFEEEGENYVLINYRFRTRQGRYRWFQEEARVERDDEGQLVRQFGIIRDVTEIKLEGIGERLLLNLANNHSEEGFIREELEIYCQRVIDECKIDSCEFWVRSSYKDHLNLVAFAGDKLIEEELQIKHQPYLFFLKGEGLPGNAWKERKPILWDDLPNYPAFVRRKSAAKANIRAGLAIPIVLENNLLGVQVLFSKLSKEDLTPFKDLFALLGQRFAQTLKDRIKDDEIMQFFSVSPDILAISDFEGKIKRINRAVYPITGYTPEELIGTSLMDKVDSRDRETLQDRMTNLLKGNDQESVQLRFIAKDGSVRWLYWSSKVRSEDQLIFSVGKDITREKKSELQRESAIMRLKKAMEISDLGYWSFYPELDQIRWSEEMYRLYRIPRENEYLSTKDVEDIWPEELLRELKSLRVLSYAQLETYSSETDLEFKHKVYYDKEVLWLTHHLVMRPNLSPRGKIFFEATCQNRSRLESHIEALAESEKRFHYALKASNEMIWDWDLERQIVHRGHYLQSNIQYTENDHGGYSNEWYKLIHPEDRVGVIESLDIKLNDGSKDWYREYRIQRKDGQYAYVADRCFIIRDAKGKAIRCIGSTLDVSNSRRQMLDIQEKNKQLKEIAWMQSHLFRAPLARIKGLMLLLEGSTEVEKTEFLRLVNDTLDEMDLVVHEITQKTLQSEQLGND